MLILTWKKKKAFLEKICRAKEIWREMLDKRDLQVTAQYTGKGGAAFGQATCESRSEILRLNLIEQACLLVRYSIIKIQKLIN